MDSILITGATGFIGRHLVSRLSSEDYHIRLAIRDKKGNLISDEIDTFRYDPLGDGTDYDKILNKTDYVIHLAGLAHTHAANHMDYMKLNSEATRKLAIEASARGIKRFLLLSTVKVHGESSIVKDGQIEAFNENSPMFPVDAYSESKLSAEKALMEVSDDQDMEYVILRPPLVFGPGVKANFLKLLKMVSTGIPLPLGHIHNKRSLIYVENLCDVIVRSLLSPKCRNQIYLVKDSDLSTPGLIREIAKSYGKSPHLFYMPHSMLAPLASLIGKSSSLARLTQSLLIDDTKIRRDLSWQAPVAFNTGLARTIEWYRHQLT